MDKANSCREFLTSYLPELKRNPDALYVFITKGNVVTRYGQNLGFEYRFTLNIMVSQYTAHPDTIFLPLILWLKVNEPGILLDLSAPDKLAFEVDIIDNKTFDLAISFPLSEAVDVIKREDGTGYDAVHRSEPPVIGTELLVDPPALLKRIYVSKDGGKPEFLIGYPPEE